MLNYLTGPFIWAKAFLWPNLLLSEKTMRLLNIFFCVLLMQLLICDYSGAAGPGTTSADFLRIPVGARETALGGTFSAVCDNSNAVYYNPAGLGLLKRPEISFSYNKYLEGVNQQWLSFAYPSKFGTLGLGFNYLSVSPFDAYDNNDNRIDSVSAADTAGFLSYGVSIPFNYKLIKSLSCGFSAKYISQRLDDKNGYGNAFDFGLLAVSGIKNLKLSFGIDNFSSNGIQFIDKKARLPKIYKTGVSYKLSSSDSRIAVLMSAQGNFPKDENDYFSAGMENIFYEILALRVGYNSFGNISKKVNFGFGLNLAGDMFLDYSYGASQYFGNIQKITLAYKFGKPLAGVALGSYDHQATKSFEYPLKTEKKKILADIKVVISTENSSVNDLSFDYVAQSLKVIAQLGKNKSEYSVNLLFGFLDSENSSISSAAALALKDFKDPDIIIRILGVKNEDIRVNAIAYLKGYKGDKILRALKTALYDKSSRIRKKAAHALGSYGEKSAMNFLIYALKNERDEDVMSEIIKALSVLSKTVKDEQ